MKPMKKRMLALLMCLSVLIGLVPFHGATAEDVVAEADKPINYGAAIGNTARVNVDSFVNFLVFSDPSVFDYDLDWDDENNWLYHEDVAAEYEAPESHVFSSDLLLTVRNYYYDDATTALWYKVAAAPGYTLPAAMEDSCWVFQNYAEEYQHDDWQEYAPDALIIDNPRNFVFDAEGNPLTAAEIGLYNTVELVCHTTLLGSVGYQWQILADDEWTDILGEDTASIPANYSLLYSALGPTQQAQLRCVATSGSKSVKGDPITITVDTYFDYDNYVHPETPEQPEDTIEPKMMVKSTRAGGVMPLAEGDDNVCYVTVQYLFENGTQAANSFVAEVPLNVESAVNVEFPPVQGYLPYYNDAQIDGFSLQDVFTGNVLYTVTYKPTQVNYTVDIYFQNIENDDYSFYDSRTYQGLTGSKVPLDTKQFVGMRELLHETPTIAADGTTHIEVYYDRIYYMTRVYLAGGYGIYSVYARYGADLQSHLSAPSRPGYTFVGWDEYDVDSDADGVPDSGGDGIANTVHPTVPAKNLAYVALWTENPTAQVNVVFWGQNPNDDGYSYLQTKELHVKPGTELTYSLSGNYVCGLEEHTHGGDDCVTKCGQTEHEHTVAAGCYDLTCTKASHNHTTSNCTLDCGHHTTNCYRLETTNNRALRVTNRPTQSLTDEGNGIYSYITGSFLNRERHYYLCINDTWYCAFATNGQQNKMDTIRIYFNCSHSHADSCYTCGEVAGTHIHSLTAGCYVLDCDTPEHTHEGTCYTCVEHTHTQAACGYPRFDKYNANLWTLAKSDTVTVERDGSSVLNVYFDRTTQTLTFKKTGSNGATLGTITDKWGADIRKRFQAMCEANTFLWSRTTDGDSPWTSFLDVMPQENRTYYAKTTTSSNEQVATYYGQDLEGNYTIVLFTSKVKYGSNLTVSAEEFVEIEGFEFNASKSTKENASFNGAKFYYDRKADNVLEFHSGNDIVKTETHLYEQPLNIYADYTDPPPPSNVEEGSHEFVGWYLNPECTRPADLATMTMPAGNLALYAKWVPNYHEVRLVKEKKDDGIYGPADSLLESEGNPVESIQVLHGTIVFSGLDDKTPPMPTNPPYYFQGWFYEDDGVELMWDFEHHPVVRDTVIYAKWSSEVLVPYTVYYKDTEGNEIAPRTTGSSLAGHSVTIEAKVGKELNDGYQQGYFPQVPSHSLALGIEFAEDGVEYTFVYEKATEKEYWVHYIDKGTGNELSGSPVFDTSSYAIVTETFKYYEGYVPDEYQKSLILSADKNENHIYFYYSKSTDEGVWFVGHYTQDIDSTNKDDPDQYSTFSAIGDVGKKDDIIEATRPTDLSEDGFTFYKAVISNGETTQTVYTQAEAKGAITVKGLEIKVYYTRNKYPYKVVYRDRDTGNLLHEAVYKEESQLEHYGKTVSEPSPRPDFEGYEFYSAGTVTIMKDDPSDITKNIIYVYLTEQSIRLIFEVVDGIGGTVSRPDAYVKIKTDATADVTATADEGYRFVGWYRDNACNNLVTTDTWLLLTKPDDGWAPATYYAKFERGVADLTIKRENGEDGQVYVYQIQSKTDPALLMYVTVVGNGSVTIHDLPIDTYTVTQQNDWSWRHGDGAQNVTLDADGETVTFDDSFSNDYWLNGNSELEKNVKGATG